MRDARMLQVMNMLAPTTPSRAALYKARWQTQLMQTKKGLGHLQQGLQRFMRHRPIVASAASIALLGCVALMWRAFGGRS